MVSIHPLVNHGSPLSPGAMAAQYFATGKVPLVYHCDRFLILYCWLQGLLLIDINQVLRDG